MNLFSKIIPWSRCLIATVTTLIMVIILGFYGLYTNSFYFFKIDNYIIPILTLIHFVFLYVLWFKIKEGEISDPKMRNLEYALYAVLFIYIFKLVDTIYVLTTYSDYLDHQIPTTFLPIGGVIVFLYVFLICLTILSFYYRKQKVGPYNIDILNEQVDTWD